MNIPLPLIDDIAAGKCLPFIGAGFSLNAKLPDKHKMSDWPGLTKILAQATGCRHREGCGEPFVRSCGVDVMDRPPEDDNRSYGGHQSGSDEAIDERYPQLGASTAEIARQVPGKQANSYSCSPLGPFDVFGTSPSEFKGTTLR
jgi:hypothetical protein